MREREGKIEETAVEGVTRSKKTKERVKRRGKRELKRRKIDVGGGGEG